MGHLSKDLASHFDPSLMTRLIRAGLCVPLFTEKQKLVLLNIAQLPCPQDLVPFVFNPPENELDETAAICTPVPVAKEVGAYPTPITTDSPLSRKKTMNFSPLIISGDPFKEWREKQERQATESKIKDLELQLIAAQRVMSQLTKDLQDRDQEILILKGQVNKSKGRNLTLKAIIKSLERRNTELEYAYLVKKRLSHDGHWGSKGLWMEYQTWSDVWNISEN
jgi:hypothetical protein